MKKGLLLLLSAIPFFNVVGSGPAPKGDLPFEFYLPVESVECRTDTCFFEFTDGEWGAINYDVPARVVTPWRDGKDPVELGRCYPTHRDLGWQRYSWPVNQGASGESLEKNDLVVVELKVSRELYRGILFDLTRYSIRLNDVEDKPLYNPDDVMWNSDPALETEALEKMLGDIHYTAKTLRSELDPGAVTGGRYKGLGIFDAMERTEMSDLRSFLSYIRLRPLRYMGNTWKVSEIYATWLSAGAPQPLFSVKKEMEDAANEAAFRSIAKNLSQSDLSVITGEWHSEAEDLAEEGRHDESSARLMWSRTASRCAHQRMPLGWAAYTEGSIFSRREMHDEAIKSFLDAADIFRSESEHVAEAFAFYGAARGLNALQKWATAKKYAQKTIALLDNYVWGNNPAGIVEIKMARTYYELGTAHMGLLLYESAQGDFYGGLEYLNDAQSRENLQLAALLWIGISEALDKLEQPAEAQEARNMAGELYKRSEDIDKL